MTPRLLLHVYPSFAVGGAQTRFAAITNHFGRRWRHAIIAMDGNTTCREKLSADLDVSWPQVDIRKGDTLGNLWRFRGLLRDLAPDLLVTSNWGSIEWAIASRLAGVRQVHVEDGFGPEERSRQLPRRVWLRRLALLGRMVVVPSQTLQRIALNIWKLNPAQVRYIPNGIDLSRFTPHGRAGEGGVVIGTVAALRAEKNLARLLRAFALVPGACRLVVVGDGPQRRDLEGLARSLGVRDRVNFMGHQAEPARFYATFDIFALSSDTEQMPLTVLEAMATGLPVAATDVGDVRNMVAVSNAPNIVPQDDTALGNALSFLAGDPAARHAIGHANRTRAESVYSDTAMFAAWAEIFGP